MGFQNWRMAPCPDLKPFPTAETSLDWTAAALSAGTLSGFMRFRLAPCLVLWDFKTDGWPPVPISNPSPQPRPPWIELRRALAWFRLAPCLVFWDFGWHLVWFYGISKLTDGPLSRSQTLPHSRDLLGLHCCCPHSRDLLGLNCCWAFGWHPVWFDGIHNWRMAPWPNLKGFPTSKTLLLGFGLPRAESLWIELRLALAMLLFTWRLAAFCLEGYSLNLVSCMFMVSGPWYYVLSYVICTMHSVCMQYQCLHVCMSGCMR